MTQNISSSPDYGNCLSNSKDQRNVAALECQMQPASMETLHHHDNDKHRT